MIRFDFVPSYGTQVAETPRSQVAALGDGYRQAADDGLNARTRLWQVSFKSIRTAQAQAIRAFMTGIRTQPFLWRPPVPDDESTLAVHLEGDIQHTKEQFDNESITLRFMENFSATDRCALPQFAYSAPNIVITCPTAGALIYYTIDGTTPTEANSLPYLAALPAVDGRTYQAIAILSSKLPSKPAAYTYHA